MTEIDPTLVAAYDAAVAELEVQRARLATDDQPSYAELSGAETAVARAALAVGEDQLGFVTKLAPAHVALGMVP